ncbi:M16 family metallopeptidase [Sphingomonas lutea]|uniref:M16 family metallopeptidase n=1 Tax=Sphingomonas lutea TaxID=1045317 RepID=UPI001F2D4452|nr:pitrilysin family protein [Sphingomonas lutea]
MRHHLFAVLLALSPLSLSLAPPAAAQQAAAVPALEYRERTLANGLRVYAIKDESSPNVSVQVWYDVGSKDDPRGRSGFAHLFEHMLFKSTRNMVDEQFDRLTEDVGGFNNASTADDYTNYFEVVPANHLQRMLWAEAERMGSLVVDPKVFASERDVVKEELRSRVLASPYGRLFYLYLPQVSYSVHPYARPGIGSIEELDAATIDDVRAFHATYYRPDNAVLVVAGRFDDAQLDAWVDQYFAPIARPATAIPRVTVAEPRRTAARSYIVHEPNVPLPAVLLSYPSPPASARDSAVMEVIDAILSGGDNSRLYRELVRTRIASEADTYNDTKQGQGVYAVYAILAGGKTAAEGEAALKREIAKLATTPVSQAELAEARNELVTAALLERETPDGKAGALAEAIIVGGNPRAADERLAQIAATTPADIQRVARQYLSARNVAAVRYLPEPKGGTPREDRIATAATVRTIALATPPNIRIVEPAPAAERVVPPPVGPEVVAALPAADIQKLANGLTVVTVRRAELPLASAALVVPSGASADPAGKAGLAGLTTALLSKGTKTRSATQIAQAVEALGGALSSSADLDGANVALTVKSDQLAPAIEILADVARNPVFAADELDRQRGITTDELAVAMQDPGALAPMVANRALYGTGAYGHPADGTPGALKGLTRDDVLAHYRRSFAPARATLVLTGDVTPQAARDLANRYFGDWAATADPPPTRPIAADSARGRTIVIDLPDSGQAAVAVIKEAIPRSDPRYYAALVANAVLGTGYSSRLNQEIRIKRGLSYGARSTLEGRRQAGPVFAVTQTKNESAPEVLALVLAEMRRLGTEPIPVAEMATRQAVLNGGFGRTLETTSGLAGLISNYIIDGLGVEEIARYQKAVSAITPAQAGSAAASLLAPQGSTIVIVGDARKFLDRLPRDGGAPIVIRASDLDLDKVPGR